MRERSGHECSRCGGTIPLLPESAHITIAHVTDGKACEDGEVGYINTYTRMFIIEADQRPDEHDLPYQERNLTQLFADVDQW